MTERKQLVVVVEGTSALGRHWNTIVSDYLEKVIRSFCGDEEPKPDTPSVELALVIFNVHGSYSSCLVQRSGWTKNVEYFMDMIRGINFNGGGFCDAAIAEGLADVLMMCPVNGIQNHQRHCILIAASNPYLLPTPVYIPPNCIGTISNGSLSDAETVAKYFKQAKRNPSETDPTIGIVKDPNYLILISESFTDARTALSKPEISNLPSNKSPTLTDEDSEEMTSSRNVDLLLKNLAQGRIFGRGDPNLPTSPGQAESATSTTRMPTNLVNDDVSTNMGPSSQQTSMAIQSKASEFVEIWEGDLYGEEQEQPLEGQQNYSIDLNKKPAN